MFRANLHAKSTQYQKFRRSMAVHLTAWLTNSGCKLQAISLQGCLPPAWHGSSQQTH